MQMEIKLKEIDKNNWLEAIGLEVYLEQKDYVAPNAVSLAEAYVQPGGLGLQPLAIYLDETLIGFAMYGRHPEHERGQWIQRFMIDQRYQGQGYGKAALLLLLELLKSKDDCREIGLCVNPDNAAAQAFYRSFGFVDTGRIHSGELIYSLTI